MNEQMTLGLGSFVVKRLSLQQALKFLCWQRPDIFYGLFVLLGRGSVKTPKWLFASQ